MQNIHVRFGVSPSARTELAFAADLACRLRGGLFVWTEADPEADALLEGFGEPSAPVRESACVSDRVRLQIARMCIALAARFCRGDPRSAVRDGASIVVGEGDAAARPRAAVVAPKGEKALGARGADGICLPFAGGESAVEAAATAVPLAARLGAPLLLYHTTWREDGLPAAAPPERHMTEEASGVLARIRAMADLAGVRHRTRVETATTIAEGTVRAALDERCALIALARGRHVGRGSYVDQVLARSVIPVMVAGRSFA